MNSDILDRDGLVFDAEKLDNTISLRTLISFMTSYQTRSRRAEYL